MNTTTSTGLDRDEEVWLAYGDYNFADLDSKRQQAKEDVKKTLKKVVGKKDGDGGAQRDWEEQVKFGGRGRTGEWRRRRWVRIVRRKQVLAQAEG